MEKFVVYSIIEPREMQEKSDDVEQDERGPEK